MSADYQTVYDAGVRIFRLTPVLVIFAAPVFVLVCLYVGKLRSGYVPLRTKLLMWGAYAFYAVTAMGCYWQMWQDQSAARDLTDARVVEGRLADGWVRQKGHSKTTDIYQHFTVKGIEFLQHNRRRNALDFLLPRAETPVLPLIEGAQVRITYRGVAAERVILKFEIASADLSSN